MTLQIAVPDELQAYVEAIGEADTLRLLEAYAGTRLYVPKKLMPDGALCRVLGAEAARGLVGAFGGETLPIPMAKGWRALIYRERQGWTAAATARKLGLTEHRIYEIVREARQRAQRVQSTLF